MGDQALLEDGQLASKEGVPWPILVLRHGEKLALRGFADVLGALDALFEMSPWALAEFVAVKFGDGSPRPSGVDSYVRNNLTSLLDSEMLLWAKRRMLED